MDSALAGQPNTMHSLKNYCHTTQETTDWAAASASTQAHMDGQHCPATCVGEPPKRPRWLVISAAT